MSDLMKFYQVVTCNNVRLISDSILFSVTFATTLRHLMERNGIKLFYTLVKELITLFQNIAFYFSVLHLFFLKGSQHRSSNDTTLFK